MRVRVGQRGREAGLVLHLGPRRARGEHPGGGVDEFVTDQFGTGGELEIAMSQTPSTVPDGGHGYGRLG